jgi:hypothetical protein
MSQLIDCACPRCEAKLVPLLEERGKLVETLKAAVAKSFIQCMPGCAMLDAAGPCDCGAADADHLVRAAIAKAEGGGK